MCTAYIYMYAIKSEGQWAGNLPQKMKIVFWKGKVQFIMFIYCCFINGIF